MNLRSVTLPGLAALLLSAGAATAQDVTVAAASEAAEGLDLQAVGELFQESSSLEAFEQALNDPDEGINNLDLDENDEVDFLRVVEEVEGGTHLVVLQAQLGEDDYQDVATIEVEDAGEGAYNVQVQGNADLYGEDYYVAPVAVGVVAWPIVVAMYRPAYRPYRSAYRFGVYPSYWRPFRPLAPRAYHARTVRWTSRSGFTVTTTSRIRVSRVTYRPRSSVKVKKTTVRKGPGGKTVKRTTVRKRRP